MFASPTDIEPEIEAKETISTASLNAPEAGYTLSDLGFSSVVNLAKMPN